MFRSDLKTAFRVLKAQKSYTAISVFSLVVGMTCFILLTLFCRYELGYDSFHRSARRIYLVGQVVPDWTVMGLNRFSSSSGPLGPTIEREFPEVVRAVRAQVSDAPLVYRRKSVLAKGQYADRGFFRMFSYEMTAGDPDTALKDPFCAVLAESAARNLFGAEDPMDKAVTCQGREYRVTGLMKDPPRNTHIPFDYLLSFTTIGELRNDLDTSWSILNYLNYVELRPGASAPALEAKLQALVKKYHPPDDADRSYFLVPLRDLRHEAGVHFPYWKVVDRTYIHFLIGIAALILVVAVVNYVNLATARASARAREVGVRKTFGAGRRQLVRQFLGESYLLTGASLAVSLGLVLLLRPVFAGLTGVRLPAALLASPAALAAIAGLFLAVGFLSGAYPALVLSSLRPTNAFKGTFGAADRGGRPAFRNALVVFQFFATMILVVGTLVIRRQLDYIRTSDIGYSRENVIALRLWDVDARSKSREIETDLRRNPDVLAAAVSNVAPVRATEMNNFEVESESGAMVEVPQITNYFVDHGYFELFGLTFVAGRPFSPDIPETRTDEVVVNETVARMAGLTNPLGKKIEDGGAAPLRIVGVVRDMHFTSLKTRIGPLMFRYRPSLSRMLFVKVSGRRMPETLAFIEDTIKRRFPGFTYDSASMDDLYNRLYESENRLGSLLTGFSLVAVLVASAGLFGLISYVVEKRRKEIGIRKVLGAPVAGILGLISKDLFVLVGIASLLSWPVAYAFSRRWLQGFFYRVSLDAGVFVSATALVFLVAALCVARMTVRAAREHPAKAIKNLS